MNGFPPRRIGRWSRWWSEGGDSPVNGEYAARRRPTVGGALYWRPIWVPAFRDQPVTASEPTRSRFARQTWPVVRQK